MKHNPSNCAGYQVSGDKCFVYDIQFKSGLKTIVSARVPWVRIPPPPYFEENRFLRYFSFLSCFRKSDSYFLWGLVLASL